MRKDGPTVEITVLPPERAVVSQNRTSIIAHWILYILYYPSLFSSHPQIHISRLSKTPVFSSQKVYIFIPKTYLSSYLSFRSPPHSFAMFASITMTAVLSTLLLAARADPTPDTPGPGDSYNAGSTCSTTWVGDANSTTAWKTMAIELMTGSNLAMTHLTSAFPSHKLSIIYGVLTCQQSYSAHYHC